MSQLFIAQEGPHLLKHLHKWSPELALGMGVHPKIVQERLGHHDIGTTMNIYSHVLPSMQEGAIKQLNNLLGDQLKRS